MPTYREKKAKLRELVRQQQEQRIRKVQLHGHAFPLTDAFRVAEKHYKYYLHRPTDYGQLLRPELMRRVQVEGAEVYAVDEPAGAYLVKGFMDVEEQFQIGFEAMNQFVHKPYRTNLDGTNGLYLETKEEKQEKGENGEEGKEGEAERREGEKIEEGKNVEEGDGSSGYYFDQRIRMANLGYQYDWPHRSYPKTQVPIPPSIQALTTRAQHLFQRLSQHPVDYHGEAVIVNYYKQREYMIGHLDDGEQDQTNPIFSFCFGLSCVFLLGFPDKQQPPRALKLQAGDLLIMSGYSRICYHGVPRIIESSYSQPDLHLHPALPDRINAQRDRLIDQRGHPRVNGYQEIQNYFQTHRLNVNIRQVWKHEPLVEVDQPPLEDSQ